MFKSLIKWWNERKERKQKMAELRNDSSEDISSGIFSENESDDSDEDFPWMKTSMNVAMGDITGTGIPGGVDFNMTTLL